MKEKILIQRADLHKKRKTSAHYVIIGFSSILLREKVVSTCYARSHKDTNWKPSGRIAVPLLNPSSISRLYRTSSSSCSSVAAPDTPAGQKNKDSERLGSKLSKTSAAKGSKAGSKAVSRLYYMHTT